MADDPRAYQHGVDFIKQAQDQLILIWASSGIPPSGADTEGEWTHDIYYSWIDPTEPHIKPVKLISAPAAQEPASADMTADGHIMITMEDAYRAENELAQTYAVYDQSMIAIKAYPDVVFDGGHSGHVAAVANQFLVFYSEGWVDGGGVEQLGSGDDVWLDVFDSVGHRLLHQAVAVGEKSRDWWPLIAGSRQSALLLWQRFIEGQAHARLMYALFDPLRHQWVYPATELSNQLRYYHYDVQFIAPLNLFFINATNENGTGFACLISNDGKVVARHTRLPPMVRESQPAWQVIGPDRVKLIYASNPGKLVFLEISRSDIQLQNKISVTDFWPNSGTDGVFLNKTRLYFVSLFPSGIKGFRIDLHSPVH